MSDNFGENARSRITGPLDEQPNQPTQAYYPAPPNQPPGYYPAAQSAPPPGYYPPSQAAPPPGYYPQGQPPAGQYPPPPGYYAPYPPVYAPPPPTRSNTGLIAGLMLVAVLLLGGLGVVAYLMLQDVAKTSTAVVSATATAVAGAAPTTLPQVSVATATPLREGAASTATAVPRATQRPSGKATATSGSNSGSSNSAMDKPFPQPKELGPNEQPPATPAPVISRPLNPSLINDQQQALGDNYKNDLSKLDDPSEYNIVANLSLKERTIDASEAITYTNNTGVAQPILYLRTWANQPDYAEGETKVSAVQVDGTDASFDDSAQDGTVLAVTLKQPLAPEQSVRLDLKFRNVVPQDAGGYGMYNYKDGVMALAAWYPVMAVYERDYGWNLYPPGGQGDPDYSEVSLYDVTLTLPSGAQAATSGSNVSDSQNADGTSTYHYVTGPMREFTMVVSDQFESTTADVNGVKVTSWYLPADAEYGKHVTTYTANAIGIYSHLFGPYPYKEVDSVEVPLGNGAGGVEFPGLVYLDSHMYTANAADTVTGGMSLGLGEERVLEFTTVHEIGHQWWYGMVGSNPQRSAFLDEGLVQYTSALYFESLDGQAAFKQQFELWCILPYQVVVQMMGTDDLVYQPTSHWGDNQTGYGAIVYGKGPLFFHALRQELGDDTFFKTLKTYWQTYKYQITTPERFIAVAEQVAGKDLSGFYNHWLLEKHGSEDLQKYGVDLNEITKGMTNP